MKEVTWAQAPWKIERVKSLMCGGTEMRNGAFVIVSATGTALFEMSFDGWLPNSLDRLEDHARLVRASPELVGLLSKLVAFADDVADEEITAAIAEADCEQHVRAQGEAIIEARQLLRGLKYRPEKEAA